MKEACKYCSGNGQVILGKYVSNIENNEYITLALNNDFEVLEVFDSASSGGIQIKMQYCPVCDMKL